MSAAKAPSGWRLVAALARESRNLAYQCAEGTAPPLIAFDFGVDGQHCAMGLALARAGRTRNPWDTYGEISQMTSFVEADPGHTSSAVLIEANNNAGAADRHSAVVFPLLAFADACDRVVAEMRGRR